MADNSLAQQAEDMKLEQKVAALILCVPQEKKVGMNHALEGTGSVLSAGEHHPHAFKGCFWGLHGRAAEDRLRR